MIQQNIHSRVSNLDSVDVYRTEKLSLTTLHEHGTRLNADDGQRTHGLIRLLAITKMRAKRSTQEGFESENGITHLSDVKFMSSMRSSNCLLAKRVTTTTIPFNFKAEAELVPNEKNLTLA